MKRFFFFSLCFSSRPGRPPKRNSTHHIDDCLDDKRIKLSSNFLLRSFSDFPTQSKIKTYIQERTKERKRIFFVYHRKLAFKYPVHSNGYVSVPTANGSQSSSFTHSFGYSAFAPTLPIHYAHNHSHSFLLNDSRITHLNDTNYKSSSITTPTPLLSSSSSSSSSTSHRPLSSSK